jgi:hypothetical protein
MQSGDSLFIVDLTLSGGTTTTANIDLGANPITVSGNPNGWTSGMGRHFHIMYCFAFEARGNLHIGSRALLSASDPVCYLGTNTKAGRVDLESVGSAYASLGDKEADVTKIISNNGTGNYGIWWNPSSPAAYKY